MHTHTPINTRRKQSVNSNICTTNLLGFGNHSQELNHGISAKKLSSQPLVMSPPFRAMMMQGLKTTHS